MALIDFLIVLWCGMLSRWNWAFCVGSGDRGGWGRDNRGREGAGGGSVKERKVPNRPFPSSKKSHFQNEAKCETFVVKMSFICIIIKTHFHINGFALSLALKVRFYGTRKWPIPKKGKWGENAQQCLIFRNRKELKGGSQEKWGWSWENKARDVPPCFPFLTVL